jgi:hypothetical protein
VPFDCVLQVELPLVHDNGEANTHPADASHMDNLPDIALMNNLHQAPLLHLLRRRYLEDAIYTFTGDILISINPYAHIEGLYDIPEVDESEIGEHFIRAKIPHVFTVAERAYKAMREEANPSRKNQSMIVSGESGAGKTEACKRIMQYLAYLSEGYSARFERRESIAAKTSNIEQRVLDCNPFLEAFGNAMTLRNNNSSRFGKFLKIEYQRGYIVGARMRHYLLEKARVVSPQSGERNYHIFYMLCRGGNDETAKALSLRKPETFSYLGKGGTTVVPGVNDAEEFLEVTKALTDVGIETDTQAHVWKTLAGIMHLGDVQFKPKGDDASDIVNLPTAEKVAALLGAGSLPEKLITREVRTRTETVTVFLTPSQAEDARDALTKSIYDRLFTWLIAQANRCLESSEPSSAFIGILDIFGFEIFEKNSFEQLCINYANEKLQNLFNHHIFIMEQAQYREEEVDVTSIEFVNNQPCVDLIEKKPMGILPQLDDVCVQATRTMDDEKFKVRLDQSHKGKHRFYGATRYPNEFVVAHFAGDVTYCVDGFIGKNNDALTADLQELMEGSDSEFVRLVFDDDAVESLLGDRSPAVDSPVSTPVVGAAASRGRSGSSKRTATGPQTIASKFKKQLAELNDTLMATSPHYVRCIKPNANKAAHDFDYRRILDQLLYSGVLETVRIRRQGYPFRETYGEFWRRCCTGGGGKIRGYRILVPEAWSIPVPPPPQYEEVEDAKTKSRRMVDRSLTPEVVEYCRAGCEMLCAALVGPEQYKMGKTKVFMKDGCLDSIHRRFASMHSTTIQTWWRMVRARELYHQMHLALVLSQRQWKNVIAERKARAIEQKIVRFQAHVRRRICRRRYLRILKARREASTVVVRNWMMWRQHKEYQLMRKGVMRFQSHVRKARAVRLAQRRRWLMVHVNAICVGHVARIRVARIRRARRQGCTRVQAVFRGWIARKKFLIVRRGMVRLQAEHRRSMARFRYRRMRAAAIVMQAWWRGRSRRMWYLKLRGRIARCVAAARMHLARKAFRAWKAAALRIERAWFSAICSRALADWVNELQSASSWGEVAEVQAIFHCKAPQWTRVQHIPLGERINIRSRFDGKTALHTAAAGQVEAVRVLLSLGADVSGRDRGGSTALHKAAVVGDSHLEILDSILDAATTCPWLRGGAAELCGMVDFAGETALDTAILEQRRGRRRTHVRTIHRLLEVGGPDQPNAELGRSLVEALGGGGVAGASGAAPRSQAWADRDERMWKQQQEMRQADPHYQLLMVQEEERRRQAERRRAREHEEAAKRLVSAMHEEGERAAMAVEDAASRAREDATRALEAREAYFRRKRILDEQRGMDRERATQDARAEVTAAEDQRRRKAASRRAAGHEHHSSGLGTDTLESGVPVLDGAGKEAAAAPVSSVGSGATPLSASAHSGGGAQSRRKDLARPASRRVSPPERPQDISEHFAPEYRSQIVGTPPGASGSAPAMAPRGATTHSFATHSSSPSTRGTVGTGHGGNHGEPSTRGAVGTGHGGNHGEPSTRGTVGTGHGGNHGEPSTRGAVGTGHGGNHGEPSTSVASSAHVDADVVGLASGSQSDEPRRMPDDAGASIAQKDVLAFSKRLVRDRSMKGIIAKPVEQPERRMTPTRDSPSSNGAARTARDTSRTAEAGKSRSGPTGGEASKPHPKPTGQELSVEAPAEEKQGPVWTIHQSNSTGMLYYFNRVSGVTQWQEPEDFDGAYEPWMASLEVQLAQAGAREPSAKALAVLGGPAKAEAGSSKAKRVVTDVPMVDQSHLGPDHAWRQHVTEDGLIYYSNSETGATTWHRPLSMGPLILEDDSEVVVMVGDEPVTSPEPTANDKDDMPELYHVSFQGKNGWRSQTDPEGYVYYIHEPSGKTQWERPVDFV